MNILLISTSMLDITVMGCDNKSLALIFEALIPNGNRLHWAHLFQRFIFAQVFLEINSKLSESFIERFKVGEGEIPIH